jgi:hypothetical protein
MRSRISLAVAAIAAIAAVSAPAAFANHSWNGYHWARTSNPFTIKLGDNVSGLWDGMLVTASTDWSQSNVLDTTVVAGGTRAKACKATLGRVEVCSARYGNTGWLGVASIWLQSGTTHIVQGTVKNNDFYFGSSSYQYNNTAEMQHVICQEIGHTFGLDHQDETGTPRHQIPRAPTRTSTTTTSWSRSTRTSTPRRQSAQRRPRAWFQPGRWVSRSTSTGSRTG